MKVSNQPTIAGVAKAIQELNDTGIILNRKTRRELAKEQIKNFKKGETPE